MNSIAGKSTGIALLMAAALLAALFSMGVFSATGVGAEVSDDPAPTVKVDKEGVGATNVTMTIMFEVDLDVVVDDNDTGSVNEAALSEIVVTLPDGFTGVAQASNRAAIDDTHGNNGTKVQVDGKDAEDFVPAQTQAGTHGGTVTINNSPATAGVPAQITDGDKVTVVVAGLTNPPNATLATDGEYQVSVIQGPASATNIAKTASFTLYDAVLSSDTPGAAVGVTLHTSAGTPVGQGQDIVVDLTGFGVPTTIAENRVIIDSDGQSPNDFSGYPSEVTVTGKKVTLTVPNFLPNGSEQMDLVGGIYRITFKQSAGITNPTSPGTKTIKVSDRDGTDDELKARVRSTVTVAPKLGPRGTDATVTGKGFASGQTATVYLEEVGGEVLGSATVTDGSFSVAIDTSSDDFDAGANTITVEGGNGADAEKTATFTITGKVEIEDVESATVADTLTLKLSDWTAGPVVDVKIGGVAVDEFFTAFEDLTADQRKAAGIEEARVEGIDGDDEASFDIVVPSGVSLGVQEIAVYTTDKDDVDDDDNVLEHRKAGQVNIAIGAVELTLSPETAVMGQKITVTGSGFDTNATSSNDVISVTVSKAPAADVKLGDLEIVTGGNITFTMTVPISKNIRRGKDNKISLLAHNDTVGAGTLVVPEAAIELDPPEARRGTTVTVTGSGFVANELVLITYGDTRVGSDLADSRGGFATEITVPGSAPIGKSTTVTARVEANATVKAEENNDIVVEAEEKHSTPAAVITTSPDEVVSGQPLTISAENLPLHSNVNVLKIGGTDITPSPKPLTDGKGAFSASVTVPQLTLGNQTIEIEVGEDTFTATVRIVAETVAASQAPADLFADLIEAGALDRIFLYNNTTQEWFLYDPDPGFETANSLESLESGDIIWIQLKSAATVQGANLLAGWSLITVQ